MEDDKAKIRRLEEVKALLLAALIDVQENVKSDDPEMWRRVAHAIDMANRIEGGDSK